MTIRLLNLIKCVCSVIGEKNQCSNIVILSKLAKYACFDPTPSNRSECEVNVTTIIGLNIVNVKNMDSFDQRVKSELP